MLWVKISLSNRPKEDTQNRRLKALESFLNP
jgi:hypothetical protein